MPDYSYYQLITEVRETNDLLEFQNDLIRENNSIISTCGCGIFAIGVLIGAIFWCSLTNRYKKGV